MKMCKYVDTMAALRLVPSGVGLMFLHALAVSQFLRVRFEVVIVALLGVVDRATIGDIHGV